ncbi:hypothetical protein H6F76_14790 [Leptolyngbya sp. FACHB-321]|uniref:type V CRISPR-associated protein Cas12k n=1 Tax=Leptolyngbya sp. FACHB-321 TaxID=2692807 RepID=UPI001682475C|nr:type V CRISPR-associated protein Cas12k [Leptolyngbya sp. FACHB-321]MBD2036282.1 hypothetical protein [Leptolyngbya sp. FACHB-321]
MAIFIVRARVIPSERSVSRKTKGEVFAHASETVKQETWESAVIVSDLIETLRVEVAAHSDFEVWKRSGKLSEKELKKLWNDHRANLPYKNLPERLARSAWLTTEVVYDSWLALRQSLQTRLDRLKRWLDIAKSDVELLQLCGCELEQMKAKAHEILEVVKAEFEADQSKQTVNAVGQKRPQQKPVGEKQRRQTSANSTQQSGEKAKKGTKKSAKGTTDTLTDALFEKYTEFEGKDLLSQCAIAHIIKNDDKVVKRRENRRRFTEKFNQRKKQLERLEVQLAGSLPKGRDLTGEKFLQALETATQQVPADDNEFRVWQANLLRVPKNVPYPLLFHSNTDLNWCLLKRKHPITQKVEERIFVHFQGMEGTYVFEVCCDRRQLPFFQQFLKDQEVFESDRKRYSATPFLLRSATLIWKKREDKAFDREAPQNSEKPNSEQQLQQNQQPWEQYELYLHCAIDHHRLTAEGTVLMVAEAVKDKQRLIKSYEEQKKVQELDKEQQKHCDNLHNQLKRLENPFPRPQRRLYKGKSNILVGLGFSREEPVTAVVIDTTTGKLITCRNTRQLLGEDYPLLSAYRLKQRQNARQRYKDQVKGRVRQISESEQGKYLDRLLAKAVVALAKEYQAGSIGLPRLKGLRERLTSAIEATAEEKFPGDVAKQEAYTKQYKNNIHHWSYSRLSDYIRGKAAQTEIAIKFGYQPATGQFIDQAKAVAMSAFHNRKPHIA